MAEHGEDLQAQRERDQEREFVEVDPRNRAAPAKPDAIASELTHSELLGRSNHLLDLYTALGIEWGADPFTAIRNLKDRAAKKTAALPARQLFDSIPLFGYELVTRERIRQITRERFSSEHDDQHTDHSLAVVAAIYAVAGVEIPIYDRHDGDVTPEQLEETQRVQVMAMAVKEEAWPASWSPKYDKRDKHDRMRCLVIAGALICAEIDRLQRLAEDNEKWERARIVRDLDPRADL